MDLVLLLYNGNLKKHSRELRLNMTDAERQLWSKIRLKQLNGLQFYRQKIIADYIVDFCCPAAKLVIEVDGSQHYTSEMFEADRKRDARLNSFGYSVLRYNDVDVLTNIEGVAEDVLRHLPVPGQNPP